MSGTLFGGETGKFAELVVGLRLEESEEEGDFKYPSYSTVRGLFFELKED